MKQMCILAPASLYLSTVDDKEPMHFSQRVGHEFPGVMVWPCFTGWRFT